MLSLPLMRVAGGIGSDGERNDTTEGAGELEQKASKGVDWMRSTRQNSPLLRSYRIGIGKNDVTQAGTEEDNDDLIFKVCTTFLLISCLSIYFWY